MHVAQRNKLCDEGEGNDGLVGASKIPSTPEDSESDVLSEEKHKPESASSPDDAHHQEGSTSGELSSLADILMPCQAVEFQDPHAPLFEYLPADQFSMDGTLESLVRLVCVFLAAMRTCVR